MYAQLRRSTGLNLQPGFNPKLKFMSHLWDKLPHMFRPLAFYAVTEALSAASALLLLAAGFQRRVLDGLEYFTYGIEDAVAPGQEPIVFMHGVGGGPMLYLLYLLKLAASGA